MNHGLFEELSVDVFSMHAGRRREGDTRGVRYENNITTNIIQHKITRDPRTQEKKKKKLLTAG